MYNHQNQRRNNTSVGLTLWFRLIRFLQSYPNQRGLVFGLLIVGALLAFELFNYTTTDFALTDLLGNMRFAGLRWATILALAFCGMDFAGIARLFTPKEKGRDEHTTEVWYLLGAWFLAATMNAMLTWWGVSIALINHTPQGSLILGQEKLTTIVPVFVAVLVWLIRILLIGTFSMAGDRLFSQAETALKATAGPTHRPAVRPVSVNQPRSTLSSLERLEEADPDDDDYPPSRPANRERRQPAAVPAIQTQVPSHPAIRPVPKPTPPPAAGYTSIGRPTVPRSVEAAASLESRRH